MSSMLNYRRRSPRPARPAFRDALASMSLALASHRVSLVGGDARVKCGRSRSLVARASIVEQVTKISFPERANGQTCVGAGARVKRVAIIDVKVYALAMYVDEQRAKVEKSRGILRGTFDKTLSVVLARDVEGKDFGAALDEALIPRLREIATNMATKEDANGDFMATTAEAAEEAEEKANEELEALRDALARKKLKSGTQLTIAWTPEARVKARIEVLGDVVEFASAELAMALLDTYVGPQAVSPGARDAFIKGLAAL